MSRQSRKVLLILGTVICSLNSVSVSAAEKTILEFGMFTGSNWDVVNANSFVMIDHAIEVFEEQHPDVEVHYYSGIQKEDYSEWCARKILQGDTPDVFMVLDSDFDLFCSLGIMENLETWMEQDKTFSTDGFFTTALNVGSYQDSQYALPYETVPTLIFVNKTLLAQEAIAMPSEDWTWDDFYEICRQVTKDTNGDGMIDQFGFYNYTWKDIVTTSGKELFDSQTGNPDFTSSTVIESLRFDQKLYNLNQGLKVTQEDFNNGKVAFIPLTFAEYRTYKTYPYKIKKYTQFQWDCTTFPAGPSGGNTSEVDALLVGISANSRKKELAWEFLKLLTTEKEMQMDIFRYSQGVSVLKSVTGSGEAAALIQEDMDEGEQVISSSLLCNVIEQGSIMPKGSRYDQIISLADSEISKMLEKQNAIESTMKIFQRSLEEYMN